MRRNLLCDLLAEASPGRCALCDERLPPRRQKFCGSVECKRAYDSLYNSLYGSIRNKGPKRGPCVGEAHPLARLTDAKVLEMRVALAQGASIRAVAAQFSISISVVSRVRRGHAWKHVQLPSESAR